MKNTGVTKPLRQPLPMLKTYLRFAGPGLLSWATKFWMPIGKNIVIIGGAIQALQLAAFLVKRGRKVTVVDSAETMGDGLVEFYKMRLFWWLEQKGVPLLYCGPGNSGRMGR